MQVLSSSEEIVPLLICLVAAIVAVTIGIKLDIRIAKSFGKSTGWGVLLFFFSFIVSLILGFGKSEYIGNTTEKEEKDMNIERVKEVFADEAFAKSVFELETASEIQAALKEKGIELSEEEITSIQGVLMKVKNGEVTKEQIEKWSVQLENGELSEEALELVSGGIGPLSTIFMIAYLVITIGGFGTVSGLALAFSK